MLTLRYNRTEQFVKEQQSLGNDVRWDGWDMVFFRPSEKAIYSREGAFRNGSWGFDNRVSPNEQGVWEVDFRNVKRSKRTRS